MTGRGGEAREEENQYKSSVSTRRRREKRPGTNEPLSACVTRHGGIRVAFFFNVVELFNRAPTGRGTTISCITSVYVRRAVPKKVVPRYADCSTRLPTPTDLGPRLRPIHEIILVHHLRASLVSRGCAPVDYAHSPYVSTWIPEHHWNLLIRAAIVLRWLDKCFAYLFLFEYKFSREGENRDSTIIFIYFSNHSIIYIRWILCKYEGGVRRLFELKEDCDWKKIILNSLKLFKFHVNDAEIS